MIKWKIKSFLKIADNIIRLIKKITKENSAVYGVVLDLWGRMQVVRAWIVFRIIKKEALKNKALKNGHKIIILTLRALPASSLAYFEAVFAYAFLKLGAEVKTLYCGGVLDSCDGDTIFFNQKAQCKTCKKLGKSFRAALGLDAIFYKDYIRPEEIKEIEKEVESLPVEKLSGHQYKGVSVGEHALASAIRYFLFGRLDFGSPEEVALLRRKLVFAQIATKVAENVFMKENPDKIFLLHGIYSTWGPFVDYFKNKGADTIVYINMTPRFGHFIFRRNTKFNEIDSMCDWEVFKRQPLTQEQEKQINNYLENRSKSKVADQQLYEKRFNTLVEKQQLLSSLLNTKYKRRYVMYPNLTWDCAIEGQISKIFPDVFSWIDATVDFFKKHPQYQLVIKSHPAELVWEQASKPVGKYVVETHGDLPENISIIPADSPINAYDLITPEFVGLVFNGTLGIELSVRGIPVLAVADNVHYKKAGIAYEIKSREEYLDLLFNPEKVILFAKEKQKMAKKYAYYYFFKTMVRVPAYRQDKWSAIDWNALFFSKQLFDKNGLIMYISNKIMKGEDIIAT